MKKLTIITLMLVEFLGSTTNAQNLQFAKTLHQGWSFIENKGQLADEKGNLLPDIKYYGNDKGVNIYCRQQSLSFVFTKTTYKAVGHSERSEESKHDAPEIEKVDYERMDMNFMGCKTNALITATSQKKDYLNFYHAHTPEEGINGVRQFEKLTYKNIYNNIDLVLYVKDKGMKYEFIIHPGGKASDIKIKWEGTSPELLENGGIKYNNSLGFLNETAPISFLQSGENLSSNFKKNGDGSISIETGEYDINKTLIIDPSLNWATYFGGSGNSERGNGITADDSGYVYLTGSTPSTSGIATSGAFQTSNGGGTNDGFLARFSKNGSLIWATYYGGTANDLSSSVTNDSSGIYIAGSTESSGMATSGVYQTSNAGSSDAFIAKFNQNGARVWSTYYGGSDYEQAGRIEIDPLGKIYFAGWTKSSSGIATSGAHQTSSTGFDGFVAKFTNTGTRIWATYYGGSGGGSGFNYVHDIAFDSSGNVGIIGHTGSTSGIATSGAHQTTYGGGNYDAFIAKFNTNGSLLWATYYGGSGIDIGFCIACDLTGNLYISGHSTSTTGISTSGAYQTSHAGAKDAFIAKFNAAGVIQWGTYYGGSSDELGYEIALDIASNIYITGSSGSSSGIATSGAYQSTHAGSQDVFITKFDAKGSLAYGTYYGGNGNDIGHDIFIDKSGIALITGYTNSTSGMATSGAHQTTYGGGNADALLISFQFEIPPAGPDKKICVGGSTSIGADTVSGNTYSWSSSPSGFSSTSSKPSVSPSKTTVYYLKITTTTSSIIYDTVKVTVNTLPNVTASADDTIICKGSVVTLSGGGAVSYAWSGGVKNMQGFPAAITTKYSVKGTDANSCSDTASITIIVNPLPNVTARTTYSSVCNGDSVILYGQGASSYIWSDGIIDGIGFIPASTDYFDVEGTDTNKCTNQASIKITVLPLPKVTAHASDTLVCKGSSIILTGGGANAYTWSGTVTDGVAFRLDTTSVFIVKGNDGNNCSSTAQIKVRTKPLPKLTLISPQKYCCDHGIIALGSASFASPSGGKWSCREKPNYIISNSFYTAFACDPAKPAIYTLLYTYQDPSSKCFNTDSTSFTINPLPTVKAIASQTDVCKGSPVTLNGEGAASYTWNNGVTNGIGFVPVSSTSYEVKGTDINNCSDTAQIKVNINPMPLVTLNINAVTITVDQGGAIYQWLDCMKNYSLITGATNQSFTATKNGDYAVKVTLNDCSDTSACITINTIGIEKALKADNIHVYPNPAKNEVHISGLTEQAVITLLDAAGKMITMSDSKSEIINTGNLSAGLYLVNISNGQMNITKKLIIE